MNIDQISVALLNVTRDSILCVRINRFSTEKRSKDSPPNQYNTTSYGLFTLNDKANVNATGLRDTF